MPASYEKKRNFVKRTGTRLDDIIIEVQVGRVKNPKNFVFLQKLIHVIQYFIVLDQARERDTLVEEKEKKFSHEDDGISKVDIVNSNFPPNRVISLIFHIKYCIRLIGLEVACLLHILKVLGSNPGANKIAILSLFPKSGGKFELRMSTL